MCSSRNKTNNGVEGKGRRQYLIFLRPNDILYTLQNWLSCVLWSRWWHVVDEHHPSIQSKTSNSTSGHQERGICQLSSSLKSLSQKNKVHFLPPRHCAAARFQKKDMLVLITHPYEYLQKSWNAAATESCLKCGCGQTDNKRHIFWCYSVQKQLGDFFKGCQNSCSSAMWVYKRHKGEWIPFLSVLWHFTNLCCYTAQPSSVFFLLELGFLYIVIFICTHLGLTDICLDFHIFYIKSKISKSSPFSLVLQWFQCSCNSDCWMLKYVWAYLLGHHNRIFKFQKYFILMKICVC